MVCKLYIAVTNFPTFSLEAAVCNHGFFMMAPNVWDPKTKSLSRPLRLSDSTSSVNVTISQISERILLVEVHDVNKLCREDENVIKDQVSRMLRLTEGNENDVQKFQQLHPTAKAVKFGRIFRAPSLFEDAVKCVLLCNTYWRGSLRMAESLCHLQLALSRGEISKKKRKRKRNYSMAQSVGNFPSAQELADVDFGTLDDLNLGYRASHIHEFAKSVADGQVKLDELEAAGLETKLRNKLIQVKGFGEFVVDTISMCSGFYQRVPIDTETRRHLNQVHETKNVSVYDKYAPFQCIAFWFELSQSYNNKFGKLSELPRSSYWMVSGRK